MRPIKYKAWDKFKKRMVEPRLITSIHFDRRDQKPNLVTYLEKYVNPIKPISDLDKVFCNEFELMQYTGLKDKSGVEVYQGDILKIYEVDENPFNVPSIQTKEYVSEVFWKDYGWVVDESEDVQVPLMVLDNSHGWVGTETEIEVIGNIYENPELIKEE